MTKSMSEFRTDIDLSCALNVFSGFLEGVCRQFQAWGQFKHGASMGPAWDQPWCHFNMGPEGTSIGAGMGPAGW